MHYIARACQTCYGTEGVTLKKPLELGYNIATTANRKKNNAIGYSFQANILPMCLEHAIRSYLKYHCCTKFGHVSLDDCVVFLG
jgi:hypothetical protein